MRTERRCGRQGALLCLLLCALLLVRRGPAPPTRLQLGGAPAACRVNESVADWLAARSVEVLSCAAYAAAHGRIRAASMRESGLGRAGYVVDAASCDEATAAALPSGAGLCVSAGGEAADASCLPHFVIPGAMKSGTGELMKWLNIHPLLRSGSGDGGKNEVHFFQEQLPGGSWQQYAARFPRGSIARGEYGFDKSPDYIRSPVKMASLQQMLPDVRLVILLRDPTERLLSGFRHNCRHGRYARVTRSLPVRPQPARSSGAQIRAGAVVNLETIGGIVPRNESAGAFAKIYRCSAADAAMFYLGSTQPGNASELQLQAREEFRYGAYHEQLSSALQLFTSERVLVLFQEEMLGDTLGTLRRVENFLGVPCYDFASVAAPPRAQGEPPQRLHAATGPRAGRRAARAWQAPLQLRERLRELYRPLNTLLQRLLRQHYGEEGALPTAWS